MTRFLFVVPPLVGHINPAVGVAAELAARGHRVAWAAEPGVLAPLVGPAAEIFPCPAGSLRRDRPPRLRGFAALKFLWEDFLLPLAEVMLPEVRKAVERFRPDVLVVDQQALAGAVVAEERGIPWATSATTSAELVANPGSTPQVEQWRRAKMRDLQRRCTMHPEPVDLRLSPHLILVYSTEELTGPITSLAGPCRFVGPVITTGEPGAARSPKRLATVLVTLGTANADAGGSFLDTCARALAPLGDRLQALIVDPGAALGTTPPHIAVRRHIRQPETLPGVDAVICHAGHNTVCEALSHGVPLVVAPIRDDQPVVAQQVVDAGAGVRVRFGRVTAERLGEAVLTVLQDPAYRSEAARLATAFERAGGAPVAARYLEELAGPA